MRMFIEKINSNSKYKWIIKILCFAFLILAFFEPSFYQRVITPRLQEYVWPLVCITIATTLFVIYIICEIYEIAKLKQNDTVLAYKGHLIIIDNRTVRVFEDSSLREIPADEWIASQGGWDKIFDNAFFYTTGKNDILKESKSKNNGSTNLNA